MLYIVASGNYFSNALCFKNKNIFVNYFFVVYNFKSQMESGLSFSKKDTCTAFKVEKNYKPDDKGIVYCYSVIKTEFSFNFGIL